MPEKPPIVLTIAGFDPSSGAGVTADIKTIAAHGCYGVACITAMTVQSTAGVKRVEAVDPALISDTLEELAGPRYCRRSHRHAGIVQGGQGRSRLPYPQPGDPPRRPLGRKGRPAQYRARSH